MAKAGAAGRLEPKAGAAGRLEPKAGAMLSRMGQTTMRIRFSRWQNAGCKPKQQLRIMPLPRKRETTNSINREMTVSKRMLTLAEARAVLEPEFAKAREIGRAEARETMQAELTKAHTALRNANSEAFKQGFKQGVKDGVKDGYQKGTEDAKETAEAKLAELPAATLGQARYLTEGFTFALNEFHKAMAEVHADRESVSHAQTRANKKFGKAYQKLLRLLMRLGVDVAEHGYADSPLNQAIIDFWTAAETELLDLVTKKLKANARKAAKDGLLSQQLRLSQQP